MVKQGRRLGEVQYSSGRVMGEVLAEVMVRYSKGEVMVR